MIPTVFNGMIALMLVKLMVNAVPHALELLPPRGNPGEAALQTVYITKRAQQAMLDLIRRATGKKAEYQLQLLLEDHQVYPGEWKWGTPEKVRALPGFGVFHTHPGEMDPKLSVVDILHLLVGDHKMVGTAVPMTYLVRAVPYGLVETADVQFAVQIKEHPEKDELLKLIPMVAMLGTPVEGLEEYYRIYEFSLGPMFVPVEVLV